ncbi:glycosyltransferase [Rouxiella badensis]|jgi:amylovoran biosynthesis glycosyltransferase AmsE|uniref:glycosyltransferase n=1 Tax=Rouxiella badensis TaxID=1646377 RepID=UPI0003621856|nr:glycosyltransferase [Rouxiella badensis]MCC3704124.1 glycosyltransferase [Rouxiella badensis]MCC3748051.1 glycosyltransferase [Rouxiella badensis]QOI56591.1 glycosyltransferase [Rouxiella badensis subsp. acadiensis]
MFSVLMSLYNKEEPQNLWECLESIKSQTLQADEIVIVYDGFVNDSLNAIVESFKDVLNIKVLPLKKNVGLGRALQKGLEYCQHEIVARMDTDDICQPNRFEKQINFILENQDVDMLGTSIIEFDEENNQRLKALPENNEEIRKFSIWKNPLNHMTIVFRKSRVMEVGGYRHHLYMEDYNLWLRMISAGFRIENMPDTLVNARVGKQMVEKRRGINYIKSEVELMRLKRELRLTGKYNGWLIFLVRSATRIAPSGVLSFLYNKDRVKVKGL